MSEKTEEKASPSSMSELLDSTLRSGSTLSSEGDIITNEPTEAPSAPAETPEAESVKETPKEEAKPSTEATEDIKASLEGEAKSESTETEDVSDDIPNLGFGEVQEEEESRGEEFDETAFNAETEAELAELSTDKEKNKWKALKDEVKELRKGAVKTKRETELEKELEAISDKASRVEEVESLLEEYQTHDYKLKVEKSKEYKDAYEKPMNEVTENVEKLSNDFDIDHGEIVAALWEPNMMKRAKLIRDLMSQEDEEGEDKLEYAPILIAEVNSMALTMAKAKASQKSLLENAKSTYEAAEAKRQEESSKTQEERIKLHRNQVDAVSDDFRKIQFASGDTKGLDAALKQAKAMDPSTLDARNGAYAVAAGATLPLVLKENAFLRKELANARGEKKARDQAKTNLSEGSAAISDNKPTGVTSFAEIRKQKFGG